MEALTCKHVLATAFAAGCNMLMKSALSALPLSSAAGQLLCLTSLLYVQQYGLLLTVGTGFTYGLYKVMMNQQTDKSGKVTN